MSDYLHVTRNAFLEEFEKLAVSHGRMTVSKSREGRRSISVENLLKKEKDGELYKQTGDTHKVAGGVVLPDGSGFFIATIGKPKEKKSFFNQSVPFISASPNMGSIEARPRKKGEVPSREDVDAPPKREDSRGNAATVPGPGVVIGDVAVSNTDKA